MLAPKSSDAIDRRETRVATQHFDPQRDVGAGQLESTADRTRRRSPDGRCSTLPGARMQSHGGRSVRGGVDGRAAEQQGAERAQMHSETFLFHALQLEE